MVLYSKLYGYLHIIHILSARHRARSSSPAADQELVRIQSVSLVG